jgi:CRP-like cAMP-binding protein
LSGHATVEIGGEEVATLEAGDIVGEMALLEREPRVATVTATDDVRALVLTPNGFNAVLDASPTVARRVMATLAQRLRDVQAA